MPELPEVETICRQLDERLAGRVIEHIDIFRTGRELPAGDAFRQEALGKRLKAVKRRAKLLIFQFSDGTAMIGHLKMTGKFLLVDQNYSPQKHDRILFVFSDEERMMWSDIRQFGYVKLVSAPELDQILAKYGPEPLEIPVDELANRFLAPKTRKIKAALLDQSTIAGIGNIYADEACFRAGIRPTRKLTTLTAADRRSLATEIVNVLKESIAHKGTSASDYVDATGTKGNFEQFLQVYGRAGEPCVICTTPISKMVLAGRGTHFCAECQK